MVAPTASKLSSAWDTARHSQSGWPLFLTSIKIDGLRGWTGQAVEFRYPVVAVAGTNGAGKSTVLKAAAAAYQAPAGSPTVTYYADDFFPSTPWEQVSGVILAYTVRQGDETSSYTVRKPTSRWRGAPERKRRAVYFLDISRIQPANTLIGYGRTAQEVISQGTEKPLTDSQVTQLNRTLGRTYDSARIDENQGKQVGILTQGGVPYSNFHQGAGEDSVLDLIALLNEAPNQSLVIIDEVEASLHPQAQRGLMTEILRLAFDKKLQVILSTHSQFILEQLPDVARIFVSVDRDSERQVLHGVTADFALNLMDDERHEELDIYCEDDEAVYLIERILALGAPEALKRARITSVGPASTVIALSTVASKAKLPRASLCIVDGEQPSGATYLRLPGEERPERVVFQSLDDSHWQAVAERLGQPVGELLDAKDAALQIENHHAWAGEIARRIGGTMRPSKVWEAIADVWTRDVFGQEAAKEWSEPVLAALPN
ncbi:ATP-dependent nuclease [Microbacterium aurantiacum]|uniref:ATP-dependent nuclease n=1 Tax=Microbacterium aurantiacum TaxID=162393 RepID=UPI001EFF6C29|nr:AAA family ATPase [Microbacterium aurantiacum]